jgi:hypothetical protein
LFDNGRVLSITMLFSPWISASAGVNQELAEGLGWTLKGCSWLPYQTDLHVGHQIQYCAYSGEGAQPFRLNVTGVSGRRCPIRTSVQRSQIFLQGLGTLRQRDRVQG